MHLSDTLSRAPRSSTAQLADEEDDFNIMTVSYISSARLQKLREHTATEPTLQTLGSIIRHGWPNRLHNLPLTVRPYFPFRDELTTDNGIVMKGHKTVIPVSLQKTYMDILDRGHPGTEATKRRARGIVLWPTMTKDIDDKGQVHSVCNSTKPHQQKEMLYLHLVPELPWSTVPADIFEWRNQQYLVLVDSLSGWFEIDLLSNLTSTTVSGKIKRHFLVHGAPHTLITDNGWSALQGFCDSLGFHSCYQ